MSDSDYAALAAQSLIRPTFQKAFCYTTFMTPYTLEEREVYTVSQLTSETRLLLEENFPMIWIEGELSNVARPQSGHLYFSLKDAFSQVRCAMFRRNNSQLPFEPAEGMQVLVQAQVSLYAPRGDFQLIAQYMEEAGDGALRRAFELLKKKLADEGLFDTAHKKPLPTIPHCIGVVTSSTGAALHDILSILKRRFASLPVILYPTLVQGSGAAEHIAQAIELANERKECDLLIVGRGGGSLEDLWPFNEERVARAIFDSKIPVVSGVGHEVDITIADYVADQRAATPSAAAELVSPLAKEWLANLKNTQQRLQRFIETRLSHARLQLTSLGKRLKHPRHQLQEHMQRLDELEQRLHRAILSVQRQQQQRLHTLSRALDAVSPLNTLERGYAILTHEGKAVKSSHTVNPGEQLKARLAEGHLLCTVDKSLP